MTSKTDTKDLEKEERNLSDDIDFNIIPPEDIVAFNELRSCAEIFRLYSSNQIDITPDFQREVVWTNPEQTRFIDSLIKQLPIPSMCFCYDYKSNKRIVIDGLQRISTIVKFLSSEDWRLSTLVDIDPNISGKLVQDIKNNQKEIFSRIENLTIPITVIRCDLRKKSHNEYLFVIFHRLNAGGRKLNNQEIRNSIFSGKLNNLLKKCAKDPFFCKIIGKKEDKKYRYSNEEFALRFFAFYDKLDKYNGKLAEFLNVYMHDNKNPNDNFLIDKELVFQKTSELIQAKLLHGNKTTLNKTLLEAFYIGVAKNINSLEKKDNDHWVNLYGTFLADELFSDQRLREGLSKRERVIDRLNRAIEIFSI